MILSRAILLLGDPGRRSVQVEGSDGVDLAKS
jgi:hypothetical protein